MFAQPIISTPSGSRRSSASWLLSLVSLLLLCGAGSSTKGLVADEGIPFFEAHVRPLLVEHCQQCHGPKKQEGGLRLDSRLSLMQGGEHGPAMVPGQPEKSLLVTAVRHTTDLQMPPAGKLQERQIDSLEQWIKQGAPWPVESLATGPALAELQRQHWAFQPVRNPPLPAVGQADWERTPIDRFVLAKLEAASLAPSAPADRRTLIRRVTLDLTGLPPTSDEADYFVNDPRPDAYPQLIERLLNSPQYGEQWGRHWLDIARYADTKGYVYGREERFWVHAPAYRDWVVDAFNQDLGYDQFLLWQIAADQAVPDNAGAQAAMGFLTLGRRFLGVTHDIIDDRIDVVTRGTMGLTVACARCHDHKYDPIPTADYYSLYGVFLNSTERLRKSAEPTVRDEAYLAFQQELDQRLQKLSDTTLTKRNEAAERVRQRVTDYLVAQTELSRYPQEGFDQILTLTDLIPTFVRRWEAWLALSVTPEDPVFGPWKRFSLLPLPAADFATGAAEIVRELTENPSKVNPRVLKVLSPVPGSMREVAERYGALLSEVDREWKAACEQAKGAGMPDPVQLESPTDEALRQVLYQPGSPCLIPNESIVSTETFYDSGSVNELWKLQSEVDRWLIQSPLAPAHAVGLIDRETIRPARIFRRGNPANRGQEVARHFVSVVAGPEPIPFQVGSGRLELAKAIIDPTNPLTARVWVNRVWQNHFGIGLVRTASDFGIRAETPSHPELLDWLATQFIAEGWSTKKLHRLILLSNTYQQRSDDGPGSNVETVQGASASAQAQARQLDPENRLLSRMNVRRLSFEEYRDSLLAIAGRLNLQPGGRASDLFAGNGTVHQRRSLYGLVDRQFLPATLRVFDFANPDLHTPLRSETTVPQQALFALNHPFVAQQAQFLAARAALNPGDSEPEKIRQLYRLVYQREPTPRQIAIAQNFLATEGVELRENPRPESLAWQYGYGALDEATKSLQSFQALPHYSGSAWQGGTSFPDAALGWVQLTATGGHPGNDLQHCAVRRWIAPADGTYAVTSTVQHQVAAGNGIRCWIFANREGVLGEQSLHNRQQEMNVPSVSLKAGETLDFVVDINGELNSDQHLWSPVIRETTTQQIWNAEQDFAGPKPSWLNSWEQLAQVLLIANELMFVD